MLEDVEDVSLLRFKDFECKENEIVTEEQFLLRNGSYYP